MKDLQVYQDAILALLAKRQLGSTICPSEAARIVACGDQRSAWREAMPSVRIAAAKLVASGRLEVTQAGKVVDISTSKGAIRLRLPPQK